MGVAVIDACFPNQDGFGLGAMWLRSELQDVLVNPEDAEIICVSCLHPQQARVEEKIKKKYRAAWIFVGGFAAYSPHAFTHCADAILIGDDRQIIVPLRAGAIDAICRFSSVWTPGRVGISPGNNFPFDAKFAKQEDGSIAVWCSRGCKKKCAFCQTGWANSYEEHYNIPSLLRRVKNIKEKGNISLVSNDVSALSFSRLLPKTNVSSNSVDSLRKGLPSCRQVRLGVEGVSQRIRMAIGKPITATDLVRSTVWLLANGKSVRWYMIAGFPGETDADWEELKDSVLEVSRMSPKGVLEVSFTAWVPEPAAPIGVLPMDDDYWPRYIDFKEWFFRRAWSPRLKLHNCQKPGNRMKKAEYQMGVSEVQLRAPSGAGPNNEIVAYPYAGRLVAARARYLKHMGTSA